jgi:hypothetical protein
VVNLPNHDSKNGEIVPTGSIVASLSRYAFGLQGFSVFSVVSVPLSVNRKIRYSGILFSLLFSLIFIRVNISIRKEEDMEKTILMILQKHREDTAVEVQSVLTDYGCFIKTRLGIHDGPPSTCSHSGLIILEMVGDDEKIRECQAKLEKISDVSVRLTKISLPE